MNAKKYMYGMIRACSIVAIASVLGGVSYSAMADESTPTWQNTWDGTKHQNDTLGQWLGTNESQTAKLENQTFNGQWAKEAGGAVANFSPQQLDITNVTFSNNKVNGDNFSRTNHGPTNNTVNGGGALYLGSSSKTTITGSTFTGNTSTGDGGAIATRYDTGMPDSAENKKASLKIEQTTFRNNSASIDKQGWGGALYNTFDNLDAKGNTFVGNSAYAGGAFANEGGRQDSSNGKPTLEGSIFTNNYADYGGGAVYNSKKGDINLDKTTFAGNSTSTAATKGFGGAVLNSKDATISSLKGATFSGNTAGQGGAIWNKGKIENLSGTFENNSATRNAGAIMNGDGNSTITFAENGTTTFSGNRSGADGGAISNTGSITFNGDITFANNSAAGNGGAISSQAGTLTFAKGKTTFTGNTAGGVKNDIFNNGNIKIGNGNGEGAQVYLDGGINGTGTLTVDKNGELYLGTAKVVQKDINMINGAKVHFTLQDQNNFGQLKSENGTITGKEGDVTFVIDYVGHAGDYDILSGTLKEESATDVKTNFKTELSDVVKKIFKKTDQDLSDHNVTFEVNSAEEMAKELTGASASTIDSIRATVQNTQLSRVSLAIQQTLDNLSSSGEEADYSAASAYIDREVSGAKSHQSPIVHALTNQLQHQALNLAQNRMDTRIDQNTPANVWADGSLNWSKYNGGFKGRDASIAAGADFAVDNAVRVGLGYAYNQGSMWESNRDIDIDSHTLMAYAQYKPADWFVNGTVSYSMSELDESIDMLGLELGGKHDVDALGMSLMGGYDLAYGLTPTVGVRYLHINGDDWDNGAMKVKMDSYDFVTGVLGLRYAQTVFDMNGWKFTPDVNIAATYDIVSDDMHSDVAWYGAAAEQVGLGRLSRAGMEAGVNLGVTYYGLGMSLGYNIDVRNHYVSHTGMLKFKYEF